MVDIQFLTDFIKTNIPLSHQLAIDIAEASDKQVIINAPIAPNINHQASVFGGSASAISLLAAWSYLYQRLDTSGLKSNIVIQSNSVNYIQPIFSDFSAIAHAPLEKDWAVFKKILQRKKKARIKLCVELHCNNECMATMEGNYVAFLDEIGENNR